MRDETDAELQERLEALWDRAAEGNSTRRRHHSLTTATDGTLLDPARWAPERGTYRALRIDPTRFLSQHMKACHECGEAPEVLYSWDETPVDYRRRTLPKTHAVAYCTSCAEALGIKEE